MINNSKFEQKLSSGGWAYSNYVRPVMPLAETQRMYIDFNVTVRIKENSP